MTLTRKSFTETIIHYYDEAVRKYLIAKGKGNVFRVRFVDQINEVYHANTK